MIAIPSTVGDIVLGSPDWLIPVIVAAIALVIAAAWSYTNSVGQGIVRTSAMALKVVGIVLLLACLLQPMQRQTRPRPQANVMAVLLDDSESMNAKFQAGSPSRHEVMVQQVGEETDNNALTWRTRLAQMFDVRDYAFDSQVRSLDSASALTAAGTSTSIAQSLESVAMRLQHRSMAGMILWSDGNGTDLGDSKTSFADLKYPVFPVIDDRNASMADLQVSDISVAQTNFETSPTTITAMIRASGATDDLFSKPVTVSLRASGKEQKLIQTQTVKVQQSQPTTVTFRFRPEDSGVQFYTVAVEGSNSNSEVTLQNNKRTVVVDRDRGPYRVLYVAGRPNWDFKFMRRALGGDAEIELVGLLRIAGKKPKFSFRGNTTSDTNPLFAGLGKDEEETASQIDEPVMIRLGVKESSELSAGFPKTDEELFEYHAVILDDLESNFFTQDQMLRLKRFVDRRGGGLLMMGGQESFDRKSLRGTPLGDLAPVYPVAIDLERDELPDPTTTYRWDLSREGWLSPWLRLRDNETTEQTRLQEMPEFRSVNLVGDAKPGARAMVTLKSKDGERQAALVTQRFGAGRTAALTVGDLWRWSMRSPADMGDADVSNDSPVEDSSRAWRQLVRWLVAEVPAKVDVQVKPSEATMTPTMIEIKVRDQDFQPLDNAKVTVDVTSPSGERIEIVAEMSDEAAGIYQAEFWNDASGGYLATVKAEREDASLIGEDEAGWAVDRAANEWKNLHVNTTLLQRIADESGGRLVKVSQLDALVDELSSRDAPITETHLVPLWHQSWVMLLAIGCLCGEWILRRTRGLA